MARAKEMLLGGAAVSLALATIAAHGLPARAQQDADVAACAELDGEALEDCLEAEAVEDRPEGPVREEDAPRADADDEADVEPEPEAEAEVEPEPAEAAVDEAVDVPGAPDAVQPEAAVDVPDLPEETEADAVDEAEPEPLEETEVEAVGDEAVDVPEAADETEVEAADEGETEEIEAEAVEEAESDLPEEPEVEAEDEAVVVPEAADETEVEAADEGETEEIEAEAVEEAESDLPEEPEVEAEDEAVVVPEAADETEVEAVDEGETEETEAQAVDAEDVLSDDELEAAQQESIDEAVQAALAAERQKSQAQQESETDDRMRILGAAAAGLAVGAFLPQIGAMLVGQQGDRVILQQDERLIVRRDETARFLQEGSDVRVEDFAHGVSLVTVTRPDGSRVLSWRDASGQVVRRVRVLPDGREITLFDGLEAAAEPEVRVTELPPIRREDQRRAFLSSASAEELLRVLSSQPVSAVEDRFNLRQILANDRIRWLMPSLSLDAVTFDTGSATLGAEEIRALDTMGRTLREMVEDNPQEVFLVEGHTDAIGSDISNLALSDRRAETMATLLTVYYEVPPENFVVQGFGEQDLRVPTLAASRENRRVELRRITPLLR